MRRRARQVHEAQLFAERTGKWDNVARKMDLLMKDYQERAEDLDRVASED